MYLVCKAIHEKNRYPGASDRRIPTSFSVTNTPISHPAPRRSSRKQKKRVNELYMYDVLRADRCISVNSIEARCPSAIWPS
jgi:asparagine synthase (glutamine-hydrolysing)